jgi:hypothetical protein
MKMTNKQFAVFLPVLVLTLVLCSVIIASAQATYGMWSIGNYAPSVSSCPTGAANSVSFCGVLPSGATTGTVYQSWNGGPWTVFGGATVSLTASSPLVMTGSTISCPTCGPIYTGTAPITISGSVISLPSASLKTAVDGLGLQAAAAPVQ